jgi:hypothetical protein
MRGDEARSALGAGKPALARSQLVLARSQGGGTRDQSPRWTTPRRWATFFSPSVVWNGGRSHRRLRTRRPPSRRHVGGKAFRERGPAPSKLRYASAEDVSEAGRAGRELRPAAVLGRGARLTRARHHPARRPNGGPKKQPTHAGGGVRAGCCHGSGGDRPPASPLAPRPPASRSSKTSEPPMRAGARRPPSAAAAAFASSLASRRTWRFRCAS